MAATAAERLLAAALPPTMPALPLPVREALPARREEEEEGARGRFLNTYFLFSGGRCLGPVRAAPAVAGGGAGRVVKDVAAVADGASAGIGGLLSGREAAGPEA
jgi:hypothetical protein